MKKIVIIPNVKRDPEYRYTEAAETLLRNKGYDPCRFETPSDGEFEASIFADAYAVLVLGGDGTILNASHAAARYDIPILAVNLGRLGYIAQLEKTDLEKIADILDSDFMTEKRAMLSVEVKRNDTTAYTSDTVLNDAVIGKLNGCGIIEFELYANGRPISYYRGDGMIFATATGSTAYSMSAGGPVIDPSLRIIEATPLAAHSLKARPTVFSDRHTLEIVILPSQSEASLTLDGETTLPLSVGDRITVTLSTKETTLISHQNDFCRVLFKKMQDL